MANMKPLLLLTPTQKRPIFTTFLHDSAKRVRFDYLQEAVRNMIRKKTLSTSPTPLVLLMEEMGTTVSSATSSTSPEITGWSYLFGAMTSACALVTILGNFLVVFAVVKERYLRTMTNYFIVSLAISDLLVGAVVMPFSIVEHLMNEEWIFGEFWCDMWHAVDVLSATASICNLCMIAIERYWATEHPMTYTSRMSKRHCVFMLLCVWVSSSVISFPAILWWRLVRTNSRNVTIGYGNDSSSALVSKDISRCEFTEDSVYLITSSIVSFYGPFLVMVLVYYRIYRTATNLLKSLNAGSKVVFKNGQRGEMVVLRIHRGGGGGVGPSQTGTRGCGRSSFSGCGSGGAMGTGLSRSCQDLMAEQAKAEIGPPRGGGGGGTNANFLAIPKPAVGYRRSSHSADDPALVETDHRRLSQHSLLDSFSRRISSTLMPGKRPSTFHSMLDLDQACPPDEDMMPYNSSSISQRIAAKLRKFAMGKRLNKFGREQKAAKTLGIVMGVFVFCWLPFFTCNLLQAFQPHLMRTPSARRVYQAVTWLGYVNSSINPIIYAHSMRDFRRAFIKILCGWYLRRLYTTHGTNVFAEEFNNNNNNQSNSLLMGVPVPQQSTSAAAMYLRKYSTSSLGTGTCPGHQQRETTTEAPLHHHCHHHMQCPTSPLLMISSGEDGDEETQTRHC